MEKKLYIVEINYQAYVWAENENAAEDFADEIVSTERRSVWSEEVKKGKNPLSWKSSCLVYSEEPEIDFGTILAGNA